MGFMKIVDFLNDLLWGKLLIFLLLGTGIYYSIRLRFPQFRQIKRVNKQVFGDNIFKRGQRLTRTVCHPSKL